jgi:hypothetical protein
MRENQRGVIKLELKNTYKLLLYEPNQVNPNSNLFNYQIKLVQVRLAQTKLVRA